MHECSGCVCFVNAFLMRAVGVNFSWKIANRGETTDLEMTDALVPDVNVFMMNAVGMEHSWKVDFSYLAVFFSRRKED